jgi:nucleotide-binding universal stress UspA family protein
MERKSNDTCSDEDEQQKSSRDSGSYMKKRREEKRQESDSDFSFGHSIDDLRDFYSTLTPSSSSSSNSSHPFHALHFLTLLDGSIPSEFAYQVALSLSKKSDYHTLLHSYEPDLQSEISPQYSAEYIYEKYSQDLSLHLSSRRFKLCWESNSPPLPLVQIVNSYLQMCHEIFSQFPHFILLGHAGEHFIPPQKYQPQYDCHSSLPPSVPLLMSSNCDLLVRTIQLPLIIAKNEIPLRREKKTWMMAVDETVYSYRGLDLLIHLINPKDTLIIFHIFNEEKESDAQLTKIENYYEDRLSNCGPTFHQFRFIAQERGHGLSDCIVSYVHQNQPDLFVIAPRVRDENESLALSSITEYVLNQVRCSIVLCKNDG